MKITAKLFGIFLLLHILFFSCESTQKKYKDPREHDSAMRMAYEMQANITAAVTADAETLPVKALKNEDAADDPAIWYNSKNPTASIIIGTDKKNGLYSYNLDGEKLDFVPVGKVNNVDLRGNILINELNVVLVSASNKTNSSIDLFLLDSLGHLQEIKFNNKTKLDDVYGYCMFQIESKPYFVINNKNGNIHIYSLPDVLEVKSEFILERSFKVASQPEGMVVDDQTGILYLGEEAVGIWKVDLLDKASNLSFIASTSIKNNKALVADIEGIGLYKTGIDTGYLIASSQGNFSYALFSLENDEYLTSFKIVDGVVDGVEETDGLEVLNQPLGEKYPKGILVVQDGFNFDTDTLVSQNFKIVSWEKIQSIIDQSI